MASFGETITELVRTGDDLSVRQIAVLLAVRSAPKGDQETVRGMAADLGISKPAVTRALDALARRILIERVDDPHDRRSIRIAITPKGRRLADRMGAIDA